MRHISTFGELGGWVAGFSDLAGFIPEEGDRPEQLEWDDGQVWTQDAWQEFVADAVERSQLVDGELRSQRPVF